jgi:2-polyprenyl-6-methoxyphenol hydroxylase-like FAD-dependent oxidoreductase
MELANCLEQSSSYTEALQNYQDRRSVFGNSIVKLGAKLGEYLTEPEIDKTRARQLSPERLIRSVAMPIHLIAEDELFDIFNI